MGKYRARELPPSWYMLGNADLGRRLLDAFIIAEARNRGMLRSQITDVFAGWVRRKILSIEANDVSNIAVEKALHKAARGDCESAGRIVRDHLMAGGKTIRLERDAMRLAQDLNSAQQSLERNRADRKRVASAGGIATAEIKREDLADRDKRICREWDRRVAAGMSPRNVPKAMEEGCNFGITARQIKNIYAQRKVETH